MSAPRLIVEPVLSPAQVFTTCASITRWQLSGGMIPWFPGGHADPWNHVEAAMALTVGGFVEEAELAYRWLARAQHADGSWCRYYLADRVEEDQRDTNVSAYVATGVLHHTLATGDLGFARRFWPTVEGAVEFALRHQRPGGELTWAIDADGTPGRFALLTGTSSAYFSMRCALALADLVGVERPTWAIAAGRMAAAVAYRPASFAPKHDWAMDWYYPVLCGALAGDAGRARLASGAATFLWTGWGCRCVGTHPWITTAETAECAMAHAAVGRVADGRRLLESVQRLRHADGSYWTGTVLPADVRFPGGERTTYSAAAIVLANDCLSGTGPAAGLFRGEDVPWGLDLADDHEDLEAEPT